MTAIMQHAYIKTMIYALFSVTFSGIDTPENDCVARKKSSNSFVLEAHVAGNIRPSVWHVLALVSFVNRLDRSC